MRNHDPDSNPKLLNSTKNTLVFALTYNEQGTIGALIDADLALPCAISSI